MTLEDFREFVDRPSRPVKNEVEKGAIRKFAEAIGDKNPLYVNEEAAKMSRYGRMIAPPTFARTFDFGTIEGLEFETKGLIHGDERFHYYRPIFAGDVLYCSRRLVDVFEKSGSLGNMTFLVYEQMAQDESGNPVVTTKSTIIYRGA
ncbi:MaoC family dehydratase N-terminal domain-containing protein [Alicyclobacillus mengziensis]|uniref:MaoC family dehydratase N-terminal domain-containing protein n=1 Tax=Alicyclobacillus mengziensis TaxID=2931921 RepID=A0A9X7VW70_9BACL|nr:MaoC family dehydratase N-terminal domain-containing protein [Alicyclobacillus mengziensis]QSO46164.1 MaoC family dehydratase N-terminal domain-containing protein [Alicyclobacillus mengziensis]